MSVRKKSRRKIVVSNREYVWYVGDAAVHICSDDKKFNVQFPFYPVVEGQKEDKVIVVVGEEFAGAPIKGNSHRTFVCPNWFEGTEEIKPSSIRRIIEWCINIEPDEYRQEIEKCGQRILWGT